MNKNITKKMAFIHRLKWTRTPASLISVQARSFTCCGCGASDFPIGRKQRGRLLQSNVAGFQTLPLIHLNRQYSWQEFIMQSNNFLIRYFGEDAVPIQALMRLMEWIRDTTGLPWWGTILLTTFALKTVLTLPMSIFATRNAVYLARLNPILEEKIKRSRTEVEYLGEMAKLLEIQKKHLFIRNMRVLRRKHYEEYNVHPFKTFAVAIIQLPLWVYMSFSIRHLCGGFLFTSVLGDSALRAPEMATEGLLWFTNMTIVDPFFLLPFVACGINLLNIQMNVRNMEKRSHGISKYLIHFLRLTSLIYIPIGFYVPSGICYYWVVSSSYGFIQGVALRNERIQSILGIPLVSKEFQQQKEAEEKAKTKSGKDKTAKKTKKVQSERGPRYINKLEDEKRKKYQ